MSADHQFKLDPATNTVLIDGKVIGCIRQPANSFGVWRAFQFAVEWFKSNGAINIEREALVAGTFGCRMTVTYA